jgi:hypothetical protein
LFHANQISFNAVSCFTHIHTASLSTEKVPCPPHCFDCGAALAGCGGNASSPGPSRADCTQTWWIILYHKCCRYLSGIPVIFQAFWAYFFAYCTWRLAIPQKAQPPAKKQVGWAMFF